MAIPYDTRSMSFDEFLKECDKCCTRRFGLGIEDMPDANWRDYHEDGLSPYWAVKTADENYWQIESDCF